MDKKEIRFSILEHSAEASGTDVHVSNSEKERIFEMSRNMYESKKKANSEPADEVSGVEMYRHPKWYRAASAAAVFVIAAAGITGSVFLVNSLKTNDFHPTTQVEGDTQAQPSAASDTDMEIPETEQEIADVMSYDMSTKEGIYHRMLDSIDFFDRASGRYIYNTGIDYREVDFSLNLETAEYYNMNTIICINNLRDMLSGMPADTEIVQEDGCANEFIYYCDGAYCYRIDGNIKDPSPSPTPPAKRNNTPMTADDIAAVREWFYNHSEENDNTEEMFYSTDMYRNSVVGESIYGTGEAQILAAYYLTDFDAWEVTGEETFNGRDCVVIEGSGVKTFYLTEGVSSFNLYVDKETGYVIKYATYNAAGELMDFCIYEEIYFDDESEMVTLDLDKYETLEYPEHIDQNASEVNSKGETYGSIGSRILEPEYIDSLPDLIEIGFNGGLNPGYIRTKEFLDIFVDGERAFDMQKEMDNVSDTAVAVEVNVYDKEGEFIFTHTFYTEPENLK